MITPVIKFTQKKKEVFRLFTIEKGEESTQLQLKGDVLVFAYVFENFMKLSINEFGINPLYCVSLPGYT